MQSAWRAGQTEATVKAHLLAVSRWLVHVSIAIAMSVHAPMIGQSDTAAPEAFQRALGAGER